MQNTIYYNILSKSNNQQKMFGVLIDPDKQNVSDLLKDANRREEVGRKGLEIAKNKFSWDGISTQLEVYLEEVAQINKNE